MNKEELEQYLKNNDIDVQNANSVFIVADIVYAAYVESEKVHGVPYTPVCSYFYGDSNNFYQLLDKKNVNKVAQKVYADFLKDPKSFDKKIEAHEGLAEDVDSIWAEYQAGLKNGSADLANSFKKFVDKSREWWHYGVIGEDKGAVISNEVAPNFEKRHGFSKEEAQQIIGILSHPTEQSVLNQERKKFLEMCLYISDNPKLKEKIVSGAYDKAATEVSLAEMINDYIRQYFWVKTDFCDSGIITAETLLQDSAKELASNSDIAGEINRIDDSLAKIKEEQKKIMGSLTLSKEDEADIFFSRKTALWIDRRKLGMMKQVYYLIAFVKDVAKIYGLPYREAAFYSVDEMIGLLQGNGAKDNGLSKEGGFVVYETGKKHRIFYGSDGWKFLELAKRVEGGSELKGMIASKGDGSVVEGVVRIVANPQSDKFAEGDILVTSMTRIEFVPLMRKARAIITNEGGIACHAAIVSRELGIPCIIGTKVATETLKSGDRVRLDMRTGIVSPL